METSTAEMSEELAAIWPHLNERQRRLVLGARARAIGRGGIAAVARAARVSRSTVQRGMVELEAPVEHPDRIRRPGGGRKRLVKKDPGLTGALEALVEPDARGDPMSPLRWTIKSTRQLAAALTESGHRVSHETVAELLHALGYSLQANRKTKEGASHPDRDAQFRYINDQVRSHLGAAEPVVSVDTKKKELVGTYKNAGRTWRPKGEPEEVSMHDFIDPSIGKAIPYGIYDLSRNTGWVSVGSDHDTSSFAVEAIRRWWNAMGKAAYPDATALLICADSGGSNGYRVRLWKLELARLAAQTGLAITVCHFPPGTSKWNKVEHRLFAHISMNWRGRPLISHEVVVQLIGATTTTGGLRVHAERDTAAYPTEVRVTEQDMATLPLVRHDFHGEWNYTLQPGGASK